MQKLQEKINARWKDNEESNLVNFMFIPVVIVGTKYDEFAKHEAEKRKWLCRALRYIAHRNDCDIVLTSARER